VSWRCNKIVHINFAFYDWFYRVPPPLASELNSSLFFLIWKTEIGFFTNVSYTTLPLVTHTPGHWWWVSYNKTQIIKTAPPQTLKLRKYTIYRAPKFTQINIEKKKFLIKNFFEGVNDPR
jgi:hypothetical protein